MRRLFYRNIVRLIDYLYVDEQIDYEMSGKPSNHIYVTLVELRWLLANLGVED